MDLRLNEDQEMIRDMARDFLAEACPPSRIHQLRDDGVGHSPELWRSLAKIGLMGVPFSEDYGGLGKGFLELCVLVEELGRRGLASPFFSTVVLCGLPIARFGTDKQKSEELSAIAVGERVLSYAEAEPGPGWQPPIELTATPEGQGYLLEGTKLFVPWVHVADRLLVVARSDEAAEGELTLFLVDAESDRLTLEPLETIGPDRLYRLVFDGVQVSADSMLGSEHGGRPIVEAIRAWGAAAKCAEMLGGAARVLEMSVEYAKEREQFGKPIGTFQAIQHHCADMAVDVDSSRFIAYEAVWRLAEGLDATLEVSMAKAWVSDAYQRVCTLGHQVHGAIGFTKEHDMQLYFKHAKESELAFGDGDFHRERVLEKLGL